eukprot:363053-Chlamydomonas_euryale.AAC.2
MLLHTACCSIWAYYVGLLALTYVHGAAHAGPCVHVNMHTFPWMLDAHMSGRYPGKKRRSYARLVAILQCPFWQLAHFSHASKGGNGWNMNASQVS